MAYTNFTVETDAGGIALVTWNMPDRSMNVFTEEVMRELNAIVDRVAGDATVKGAVITSGKETFSGGADITMLQKMLKTFAKDKAKDPEKATKALFDNAGYMTGLFRKLETVRQALGVGDQRHLHGRRIRALARLPRPRRSGLGQGEDGAAGSEDRHFPGRRRHAARPAPDRPAAGAADADLRPDADPAEGQGHGPDPRRGRARTAGRNGEGR